MPRESSSYYTNTTTKFSVIHIFDELKITLISLLFELRLVIIYWIYIIALEDNRNVVEKSYELS